MAHYAFLDKNNVVTEVIYGINENELIEGLNPEVWYGQFRGQVCKRTSYNGNTRKNYAAIGFTYDETGDAFYAPQPYPSWKLDRRSFTWKAPVAMPADGKMYQWDETGQAWNEVSI
jgi:hypothetical protein